MKLENIAVALHRLKDGFDIDGTDAMLLNDISIIRRAKGEGTIMEVITTSKLASPATLHGRIKRLVKKGLLIKVVDDTNLRYKRLEEGPRFEDMIKVLSEV